MGVAVGAGVGGSVGTGARVGVGIFFGVGGCLALLRILVILTYTFVVLLPKFKSVVGFFWLLKEVKNIYRFLLEVIICVNCWKMNWLWENSTVSEFLTPPLLGT